MPDLNYAYTVNTPQPSQQINSTQTPIYNNFQDISQFINVNHVGFNTADTFGTHNVVDYYAQSADPTTGTNEIALYAKPTNDAGGQELFYRYANNGQVVQLTPDSTSTAGTGTGTGSTSAGSGTFYNFITNTNGSNPLLYYSLSSGSVSYNINFFSCGYQYLTGGALMLYASGVLNFTLSTSYSSYITVAIPFAPLTQIPTFKTSVFNVQYAGSSQNLAYEGTNVLPYLTNAIPSSLTEYTLNIARTTSYYPSTSMGASFTVIAIGI